MTYATTGAVGRLGYNITGFGTAPLSATAVGQKARKNVELYVFAGADGRAVLQNIFIRGGNSRIEHKPFVVDMRGSVSARYRCVRFTYNYVRRSRELTSPVCSLNGATSARLRSRGSRRCTFTSEALTLPVP